jgi:hypothetical protein
LQAKIFVSLILLVSIVLTLPLLSLHSFATVPENAPSTPGCSASSTPIAVTYPSQTELVVCAASSSTRSISVSFSLSGPGTTSVDIGVNDQFFIGDEYSVTLNGNPLFTTTSVTQPASVPPSTSPTPVAIQTDYSGCDLASAHTLGLSVGDATVSLAPGSYTLKITDIASSFLNLEPFSPAGFCLSLEAPPSFSVPQFPLGTSLIFGVLGVALVLMNYRFVIKRKVLP